MHCFLALPSSPSASGSWTSCAPPLRGSSTPRTPRESSPSFRPQATDEPLARAFSTPCEPEGDVRSDDAVSPVVGTLIMLGIAAVLGAAVWLIVANLAKDQPN